jgi:hypothetical protein
MPSVVGGHAAPRSSTDCLVVWSSSCVSGVRGASAGGHVVGRESSLFSDGGLGLSRVGAAPVFAPNVPYLGRVHLFGLFVACFDLNLNLRVFCGSSFVIYLCWRIMFACLIVCR